MEEQVRYQVASGRAVIEINRPLSRNALNVEVMQTLSASLERAERDPAVRVVILTGAGEKVFCAGGDFGAFLGSDETLSAHDARALYGKVLLRLQACQKPTLARVNGHALAGGLGLMLACDLAIATDRVEFATPEVQVGLFPMMLLSVLQRHVGRKRAMELLLLGERISAATALQWGLLNQVVPVEQLDAAVNAMADKLAAKSTAVLRLGRAAFYAAEDMLLPNAVEFLASQLSVNFELEDAAEGVTAFLEKRAPQFKDR